MKIYILLATICLFSLESIKATSPIKTEEEKNISKDVRDEEGVNINGTIWATRNSTHGGFEKSIDGAGDWFINPEDQERYYSFPGKWELPTVQDFINLFNLGGVFDLEISCWRFGSFILPAAGEYYEKQGSLTGDYKHEGRNMGYYLCKDGVFWFNLESQTYGHSSFTDTYYNTNYWNYRFWKVRLIKKKNYNKYFD